MGYRYETHLHTKEGSACSSKPGREYVEYYKNRGYSGIIITDHFFRGNSAADRSKSWRGFVEEYCSGYFHAKEEGDKQGFQVFFGIEDNFQGDEYLVYGITPEWLAEQTDMLSWSREEYYSRIKAVGGIVIQAHPFRERGYLDAVRINPFYVDGIEAYNVGNLAYMDGIAYRYGKEYGFPMTAGSDMHHGKEGDVLSGIEADEPLHSIEDFVKLILSGKGYSLIGLEERLQEAEASHPWIHSHDVYRYEKDGSQTLIARKGDEE